MYLLNSPAYKAARHADQQAHDAIRRLLDGGDPPALPPPAGGSYGRWTPTLERLFEAHAAGGTPAVAVAYQELYRADDRLIALMGSGGMPPGVTAAAGDGYTPRSSPSKTCWRHKSRRSSTSSSRSSAWASPTSPAAPRSASRGSPPAMALALSTGGKVLGFQGAPGQACSTWRMEDSAGRLQNRFHKAGRRPTANSTWRSAGGALDAGGLEDLDAAVRARALPGRLYRHLQPCQRPRRPDGPQRDDADLRRPPAAGPAPRHRHRRRRPPPQERPQPRRKRPHRRHLRQHRQGQRRRLRHRPLPQAQQPRRDPQARRPRLRRRRVRPHLGPRELHLAPQRRWQARRQSHAKASPPSIHDRKHVGEILEALDALGPCSLAALAAIVKSTSATCSTSSWPWSTPASSAATTEGGAVTYAPIPPALPLPPRQPAPMPHRRDHSDLAAPAGTALPSLRRP